MADKSENPQPASSNDDGPIIPDAKSLPDPPTDAISKLSFLPSSSLLASTSWDGAFRLHDCDAMESKLSHSASMGPLLSLAVADEEYIFVGGLGGSIVRVNLAQGTTGTPILETVGAHPPRAPPSLEKAGGDGSSSSSSATLSACSCLVTLPSSPPLLASAGWHGKFHLWDLRQSSSSVNSSTTTTMSSSAKGPVVSLDLPGKAFTMDTCDGRVVVGCSGRRTCLLDIRKKNDVSSSSSSSSWVAESVVDAESSQKHQTRCIKFFPDGQSIAVGSVEGRVAVESVSPSSFTAKTDDSTATTTMKKVYAFKCHRDGDLVYPVNCIDFHPKYGTFATGGCDGTVVTWDGVNRKRLTSFRFPTSVASLCFNHDGSKMAVASSYTFEDGEREHPRDEIYIRPMLESECAPKQPQ
ncbi:hypothetical protein ACA910_010742 [Epithemia clementina (nom. ined.)]